jgi:hypothetical protein
MEAATWQRYVQMGERDAGSVDFEDALRAADSVECDEDFDFELGEAWGDEYDPVDDEDPE